MRDLQTHHKGVRSVHVPAQRIGRRRLLIGAGTLSLGALLASAAGTPPVTAAARPGGLPIGNWTGDVVVTRARAWNEPESSEATDGPGDTFAQAGSVLQLSGGINLTVAEPASDTAVTVTGMLDATWSVRTAKRFSDGRRIEEARNGRLTGGDFTVEADPVTGAPRLIVRGAMWAPGAFPSFTIRSYGPDGSPGPVGDGMVAARVADPLVMAVAWYTPDLIVGNVEADQLRPPGPPFGGGIADPSAQATDLHVTTAANLILLRTVPR